MIILQLKSTQQQDAFENISSIINELNKNYGYKVTGHEVHQTAHVMAKTSLSERAEMVSRFCARNEIRHLAYHSPILGGGKNIWDKKWQKTVKESIALTVQEASLVRKEVGLSNDVVIVFHLTSYLPVLKAPRTYEEKISLYQTAEEEFLKFFFKEGGDGEFKIADNIISDADGGKCCTLAVENVYPRYDNKFVNIGPFHPIEVNRMERHGIKTALDLAHYHLYSSYLRYGEGSLVGDLDRERFGKASPSWQKCIEMLASSLVLLHISDAKGYQVQGEGLALGKDGLGEIPIAEVLRAIVDLVDRDVLGTIELNRGHLQKARLQFESAKWLLQNVPDCFEMRKKR